MPVALLTLTLLLAGPSIDLNLFHGQTLIVDLHVDTLYQLKKRPQTSFLHGPLDLTKHTILRSGLKAQFFSIWVPDLAVKRHAAERYAWDLVQIFERLVRQNSGWMRQATRVAEIEEAFRQGKFAALLGMEGASPLGRQPANLRNFARRGVRYIGITWNRSNAFGDPAVGPKRHGGLSQLGRELVREANQLGVMPDVSHASVATFWDVLRTSTKPVIASHSNARALCPHPRNLDDEQLKAIARSGGVVGINFFARYLTGSRRATIDDIVRHTRYIADLIGWRHVALGSDLDGSIVKPIDFRTIADLPRLTAALSSSGVSLVQLTRLYGTNVIETMRRSEGPGGVKRVRVPLPLVVQPRPNTTRQCLAALVDRNRLTSCELPLPADLIATNREADLRIPLSSWPSALGVLGGQLQRSDYRLRRDKPRVRRLDVALLVNGRTAWQQRWSLADRRRMQLLAIAPPRAGIRRGDRIELRLRVLELYAGSSASKVAVISEIVAYGP